MSYNLPLQYNPVLFIKRGQDADLNDVVCNDLSVNGTLTYNEAIVIDNKTINGDLTVLGDTSLNNLFVRGVLRPEAQILDGNILGNDQNIVGLSRLEADDISASTLLYAKQAGINVTNDEAYATGNNVLRIAGHTNITNFVDDMTQTNTAQLVLGKVADNQYIKFKTEKTGTGIGASSIDFDNINADATDVNYLAFKNDGDQVGYINNDGKMRMKQLEVKIDSNDGTYMNFRDNAGDTADNDIATFKSGIDSGEFPSAHFIDVSFAGDYASTPTEIFMSTDKTKASYIDVSFVGINTKTPVSYFQIDCDEGAGAGLNYRFNNNELYLQNSPNTTGNETRRIVADSTGELIKFKVLSELGTGTRTNTEFYIGNMLRDETLSPSIRSENASYKGQRWITYQPAIGDANTEEAFKLFVYGTYASSATGEFDFFYDGNMEISGTLTQGSDQRLKENIIDANTTNLISDFQKLRFVNFNMIDDEKKLKKLGVIAQDLQNIYPSAVVERNVKDEEGNITGTKLSVKYEVLYLKSCMLVQHLLTENEVLKTRLTNLESQVNINNTMLLNLTNNAML
jgi:hypothetical protein